MPQSTGRKRQHSEGTNGESPVKKREAKEEGEVEGTLSIPDIVIDEKAIDTGVNVEVEDTDPLDCFPIMALPTELISHSISFLEMKDRRRVTGVNKRLTTIEMESKYYVGRMMIEEKSTIEESEEEERGDEDNEYEEEKEFDQRITFYKEKSYSSDCIRRISKNVSIGHLLVICTGSNEFHREVYNMIKEFDIRDLFLGSEFFRHEMLKELMVDSFFLDLTRACKTIHLFECEKITSEALYQVYKNMIDNSTKLRRFATFEICKEKIFAFFSLIEITFRDGRFFTKKDVQVYACTNILGSVIEYSLFVGSLMITVNSGIFNVGVGSFSLELHETQESLEKTKNGYGLTRMDINPE